MSQTVLVADDSRTIRTICQWLFKGTSYQMIPAETGAEALSVVQQRRPGLIILDYTMPDQDSYNLCRQLKSHPNFAGIPILMMGGKFAEFDAEKASACGADDSIMKPFKSEAFLTKVGELFEKAASGNVRSLASAPAAAPPPARAPQQQAAPAQAGRRFNFPAGQNASAEQAPARSGGFSMSRGGQAPGRQAPPSRHSPAPQAPPSRHSPAPQPVPSRHTPQPSRHTPQPSPAPQPVPARHTPQSSRHSPAPQPAPQPAPEQQRMPSAQEIAAASIDPAVVREEIQKAVKEMLPTIVRGVLKELITKEVTPHLQRWVESKVETLTDRKIQAEFARLRGGR